MGELDTLMSALALPASYRRTVEAVHRPVAAIIARRQADLKRPVVVGLCGSQGSGKSTMAAFLETLLQDQGLRAAILSLDDLYLTRRQREHLAQTVHPLLLTRGAPGTHDPGLGMALIDVLTDQSGAEVSLPRFDKAEDDRASAQTWPRVRAPIDVVLLEGWCVGAAPQSDAALTEPVNALERDQDPDGCWRRYVNAQLKGDYARLFARIDVLALLQAPSFDVVFGWRALQEKRLAERLAREGIPGRRVMSDEEIGVFLMHYQRLTEWILEEMTGRADIVMPIDPDHRITGVNCRPAG